MSYGAVRQCRKGVMESLLKIKEIANGLGVAPRTAYLYVENGTIPSDKLIRINGNIRMKEQDLEKFIEANRGK